MKRALAERAKQSLPHTLKPQQPISSNGEVQSLDSSTITNNNNCIASTSSLETSALPPIKIPRLHRPTIKSDPSSAPPDVSSSGYDQSSSQLIPPPESPRVAKSTELNHPPPRPFSNGEGTHGKKPSNRTTSVGSKALLHYHNNNDDNDHDDEEEGKTSAFFLRHQNSALATELKSLQHSVSSLTKERDIRRQECYDCVQALHSLHATWTALESALSNSQSISKSNGLPTSTSDYGRLQSSTGDGDSVEWSRAIQHALEAIGNSSLSSTTDAETKSDVKQRSNQRKRKLQDYDSNGMTSDDSQFDGSSNGTVRLDIATNIASRAQVLQDVIWKRFTSENGISGNAVNSSKIIAELEKRNALLEVQKQSLHDQISELVASRNDTITRERRIRRNVYRLAAGMLSSDQVVKSTETDEDIAAEVETDKQNRIQIEQLRKENEHLASLVSDRTTHTDTVDGNGNMHSTISQGHADSLMKQIADLEDEVTSLKSALSEVSPQCIILLRQHF
jgi:hypothetical protein